jgi:hypothetical protein
VNTAVALVISSVPIDLSQYAESLLEKAAPLLGSQNPGTRLDAQALVASLAKQCSDASAAKKVLQVLSTALKSKL